MHYTQLFRSLREARGLSVEALAERSGHHRNTVLNVESGRPVKFKTIAELMAKLGYSSTSPELRSMALLWMEETSGIPFSRAETEQAARKTLATYGAGAREAARRLNQAIADAHLTPEQIDLLVFAARHPAALAILSQVRDLSLELRSTDEGSVTVLKAAEDEEA